MAAPLLIVGQGLAGTMLGWAFARAGFEFAIADAGHGDAASRVGAGIINPITGQRLVKSWRVDEWLPGALQAYREVETRLGVTLVHPLRVRRLFADDVERRTFAEKRARGELAPFLGEGDDAGFWIEGAARVDTAALIAASRRHWLAEQRLREERVDLARALRRHEVVIDCTGAGVLPPREGQLGGAAPLVPWQHAKGEILAITVAGLDPGVILNRGHWILPVGADAAWVGATYDRAYGDLLPSPAARAALERSAVALLGKDRFTVTGHFAGVRVATPDRRPVAGRSPGERRLGCVNGLGSKGALLAPGLARQWVHHLAEGVPFDWDVDPRRFS